MLKSPFRAAWVLLGCAVLWGPNLYAETLVQKMSLEEISQRADKIFRGTVVSIANGAIEAGGSELPTITYRIKVEEAFQGEYVTKGDAKMAEITMLGRLKPVTADGARSSFLVQLPELRVGQRYVLLTSPPSAIGLSTTVGLGQGCFSVLKADGQELVKNELGVTMTYDELVAAIRAAIR